MALIIDTYNVIYAGCAMGGALADLSVRRLCQWLIAAPHRQKTTLVIDGRPKPEEPGIHEFPELHLHYSGAGVSADDVIRQLVERSGQRKNVTVVTNDRAVQTAARGLGAHVVGSEAFLQSLVTAREVGRKLPPGRRNEPRLPSAKTRGLSGAETEHWLKQFGINPADVPHKPKKTDDPDDLDMQDLMGF